MEKSAAKLLERFRLLTEKLGLDIEADITAKSVNEILQLLYDVRHLGVKLKPDEIFQFIDALKKLLSVVKLLLHGLDLVEAVLLDASVSTLNTIINPDKHV